MLFSCVLISDVFSLLLQYESFRKEEEEKIEKEGQVITLESDYICVQSKLFGCYIKKLTVCKHNYC